MSRLDEIEALLKARTERGPWTEGRAGNCNVVQFDGDDISGVAWVPDSRNVPLIASAPTDLAYLLRVARAAERAIECGQSHNLEYAECSCGLDALRRALEGGGE